MSGIPLRCMLQLVALKLTCGSSKQDPRRYLHTALWPVQLLIWAALLGVTFAMPNGVFVVWGQVTSCADGPATASLCPVQSLVCPLCFSWCCARILTTGQQHRTMACMLSPWAASC